MLDDLFGFLGMSERIVDMARYVEDGGLLIASEGHISTRRHAT